MIISNGTKIEDEINAAKENKHKLFSKQFQKFHNYRRLHSYPVRVVRVKF